MQTDVLPAAARRPRLATHPLVYIGIAGVLGVAGQLMLKSAMTSLGPLTLRADTVVPLLLTLALDPRVIGGLAVYVVGTFFWLMALSRVDLSYAYPFASLNYVLILLASWLVLGETPTTARLVGVLAIGFGVWAISHGPSRTERTADSVTPPSTVLEGANR
jgi:multidrug transporter EmrE-like cation transporter